MLISGVKHSLSRNDRHRHSSLPSSVVSLVVVP
jgi:hypothetical protein